MSYKTSMNYEEQIDKAIREHEECKPCPRYKLEWISNRIDWCWKWSKISREKKDEFCDRMIAIFEGNF